MRHFFQNFFCLAQNNVVYPSDLRVGDEPVDLVLLARAVKACGGAERLQTDASWIDVARRLWPHAPLFDDSSKPVDSAGRVKVTPARRAKQTAAAAQLRHCFATYVTPLLTSERAQMASSGADEAGDYVASNSARYKQQQPARTSATNVGDRAGATSSLIADEVVDVKPSVVAMTVDNTASTARSAAPPPRPASSSSSSTSTTAATLKHESINDNSVKQENIDVSSAAQLDTKVHKLIIILYIFFIFFSFSSSF